MINDGDRYLKLKMKYDGVRIKEFIELEPDIGNVKIPYDLYHLIMKNVASNDKNTEQIRKSVRSDKKTEKFKLLVASVIAVILGLGLSGTNVGSISHVIFPTEYSKDKNGVVSPIKSHLDGLITGDEEAAVIFQRIYDKYKIKIPKLGYLPGDMEYYYSELDSDRLRGILTYKYQGEYMFHYQFIQIDSYNSASMFWDNEVKETYRFQVEDYMIEVRRHEIAETKQTMMSAQLNIDNIICTMSCVIEQDEFDKIIKNIIFSY